MEEETEVEYQEQYIDTNAIDNIEWLGASDVDWWGSQPNYEVEELVDN
jgi:hypothetical protein